ncbi:MAG: hypothetical protein KDD58_07110 [Bdellovibrionales bacterium]|nr:hypothetical protein [Bdellovibrionales bacterium]
MKKLVISLFATTAFMISSANAFVVGNSEQCTSDSRAYTDKVEFSALDSASQELTYAAGKIDSMENEPAAFVVDVTAGTAVRVAQTGVDLAQDGSEAIYKLVSFVAETPKCAGNAKQFSDGVDCIIQLPNKTITMTAVTGADMAETLVVGVYSVGSGALGALEDLTTTIADGLKSHGTAGEVAAVPFVVISLIAQGVNYVAEVVLYDTLGGGFANLSQAFVTMGTDICDIFSAMAHLRLGKVVEHSFGLVIDTAAEGANLLVHLVTLGRVSLREKAKKANYPKSLDKKDGFESYEGLMEGVN